MPAFDAEAPLFYYLIPEHERAARCELSSDVCVVDGKYFFVRGCIEIPVHGADEPFVWGVWVSLSEASFSQYRTATTNPGARTWGRSSAGCPPASRSIRKRKAA